MSVICGVDVDLVVLVFWLRVCLIVSFLLMSTSVVVLFGIGN